MCGPKGSEVRSPVKADKFFGLYLWAWKKHLESAVIVVYELIGYDIYFKFMDLTLHLGSYGIQVNAW